MRYTAVFFAAVLVASCAHRGGPGARAQATEDEAALAKALSGRVAEAPLDCVSLGDLHGNTSYGLNAILFGRSTDDVVYVNRPPSGCPILDSGRALKTRTPTARLCRGDIVTVFDPVSGMSFGSCSLGEFTPYRRAAGRAGE